MLEVIYISPSCRKSAEFIDRLFWDLRKHEVYDIKISPQRLQLESERFIVSAVDIGMQPRSSFHGVKYYIDGFNYVPQNYSFERLCEWAEHIKCRFRPDTKEISEEELIEILTEVST